MKHAKLLFIFVLLFLVNSVFAGRYYDAATGRWLTVDPLADNYPSWSPYNYTLDNPVNNVDPDGKAVETAFDVVSVGLSAYDLYQNPSWSNAGWLLADIAGAALPFVPAVGIIRHAGKIDDVVDLVKGGDKASDLIKNVERGKKGEKIATEALQKEFKGDEVLEQVTGKFKDGKTTRFDNVVVDSKTGKVKLVNETKTGNASFSKNQKRYHKNGESATLTGKNAGSAKGQTVNTGNTNTRETRIKREELE